MFTRLTHQIIITCPDVKVLVIFVSLETRLVQDTHEMLVNE